VVTGGGTGTVTGTETGGVTGTFGTVGGGGTGNCIGLMVPGRVASVGLAVKTGGRTTGGGNGGVMGTVTGEGNGGCTGLMVAGRVGMDKDESNSSRHISSSSLARLSVSWFAAPTSCVRLTPGFAALSSNCSCLSKPFAAVERTTAAMRAPRTKSFISLLCVVHTASNGLENFQAGCNNENSEYRLGSKLWRHYGLAEGVKPIMCSSSVC
jgi:hypothetical protein